MQASNVTSVDVRVMHDVVESQVVPGVTTREAVVHDKDVEGAVVVVLVLVRVLVLVLVLVRACVRACVFLFFPCFGLSVACVFRCC